MKGQYIIVTMGNSADLIKEVNNAMKTEGWLPLGGAFVIPTVDGFRWNQTLVREIKKP